MKLFKTVKQIESIMKEDISVTPANADSKYDFTKLTTRAGDEFTGDKLEEEKPRAGEPYPSLSEQLGMVESTDSIDKEMDNRGYFPDTVFTYEDVPGISGFAIIHGYNIFRKNKEKEISVDPKKSYNPDMSAGKKIYALVSEDGETYKLRELSESNDGGHLNSERIAKNRSNGNKRGVE